MTKPNKMTEPGRTFVIVGAFARAVPYKSGPPGFFALTGAQD